MTGGGRQDALKQDKNKEKWFYLACTPMLCVCKLKGHKNYVFIYKSFRRAFTSLSRVSQNADVSEF